MEINIAKVAPTSFTWQCFQHRFASTLCHRDADEATGFHGPRYRKIYGKKISASGFLGTMFQKELSLRHVDFLASFARV
ncbi:MAG: hypothetical protein GY822_13855 [Deltaproteobacteria bacterium]|nr:hypothetical protein [Deltaproteobacteria bacterium]